MKAVVLAGGEGSRLRPITHEIPKPLITVKRKPILSHIIEFLVDNGVSDIAIIISKSHKVDFDNWFKSMSFPIPVTFFVENELAGTFGCLRLIKNWIKNEDFVLANGDSLIEFDLSSLIEFHIKHKGFATSCIVQANSLGEYIVPVIVDDKIKSFERKIVKPATDFIHSGLCVVKADIFMYDDLGQNFLQVEKDIFPKLIDDELLFGCVLNKSRFYDCGTLESWEQAIKEW